MNANRVLQPQAAYGLNLSARSCMEYIDTDHAIYCSGSMLILQHLEDSSRFVVLPLNKDGGNVILGLAFHHSSQTLAVATRASSGQVSLILYYTHGLKVGEDVRERFRRARCFDLPTNDSNSNKSSKAINVTSPTTSGGGGGSNSNGDQEPDLDRGSSSHYHVSLAFSGCGKVIAAEVDGTIHAVDWPRSRFICTYSPPGGKVKSLRFDPHDSNRVSTSGNGFVKLWRFKNNCLSPQPDIQGADFVGHELTDHRWLEDGSGLVVVSKQGMLWVVDPTKNRQHSELALDGLPLYSVQILRSDLFVALGSQGHMVIYKEGDGGRNTTRRRNTSSERFVQNRVVVTKDRHGDVLGGALNADGKRMAIYTKGYMGSVYCENLPMKRGLEDESAMIDVNVCREFHAASVKCLSSAARKPLLVSCTVGEGDCSVRVWNCRSHRSMIVHPMENGHLPTSVSIHPSGMQLLVSLEDRVQVYHIMERELRLAYEIPIKGVLRIPNTKQFVNQTLVSNVTFNHGGNLFAVITGKVVQVFSMYSVLDGLPARESIFSGHISDVTCLAWSLDDLRLYTCSKEAIFEWELGKLNRVKESNIRLSSYVSLAVCPDGTVAAARLEEEPTLIPETHLPAKSCLCLWPPGLALDQPPKTIFLQEEVTNIVATTNLISENSLELVQNIVIVGTNQGDLYVVEVSKEGDYPASLSRDVQNIKRMLHSGPVLALGLSVDNTLLFSTARDGGMYVCDIRVHRENDRHDARTTAMDTNEAFLTDDAVTLAERSLIVSIETQIMQLQADLVEQQSINNSQIESAAQEREKAMKALHVQYDLTLRDEKTKVANLEQEVQRLETEMMKELKDREAAYAKGATELELHYQKKLTAAAMQYKKLKNAFNDLVVAAKDDCAEVKADGQKKEDDLMKNFDKERTRLLKDQELLRGYADYLKAQYNELLDKEDKVHDDEMVKLKLALDMERQRVATCGQDNKRELHILQKEIAMLHQALTDKDDKCIDLQVKLDSEVRKTTALNRKIKDQEKEVTELYNTIEKWEAKAGEQEKGLIDLQKTRNVLLCQLREIRDAIPLKDKEIGEMKIRLQEIDMEYGKGLQSRADSDKKISEQSRNIKNLQQELLHVRRSYVKKDNVLSNVREEIRDFVHGKVQLNKEQLDAWKERLREHLPCLDRDANDSEIGSIVPMSPTDIAIADQAKQKLFLQRDITRLSRKLQDSKGLHGKLVKIRTSQNNFLMKEMNNIRRMNRKLQLKLRDMTAKYENEVHRRPRHNEGGPMSSPPVTNPVKDFMAPTPAAATTHQPSCPAGTMKRASTAGFLPRDIKGVSSKGSSRPGTTITEGLREVNNMKETHRANEAEAALDVALSENRKLASMLHALNGLLKTTTGHTVEELFGGGD